MIARHVGGQIEAVGRGTKLPLIEPLLGWSTYFDGWSRRGLFGIERDRVDEPARSKLDFEFPHAEQWIVGAVQEMFMLEREIEPDRLAGCDAQR